MTRLVYHHLFRLMLNAPLTTSEERRSLSRVMTTTALCRPFEEKFKGVFAF